jgi:hypothetical protein
MPRRIAGGAMKWFSRRFSHPFQSCIFISAARCACRSAASCSTIRRSWPRSTSSCTCFRGCRARPIFPVREFPELAPCRQNWQIIRAEALHLIALKKIKASEENNDAGFNSFFKTGWKRFYLKWYDASHPSAERLCPQYPCAAAEDPVGQGGDVRRTAARRQAESAPRSRSPARCATTWAWPRRTTTAASSKSTASATAGATARA